MSEPRREMQILGDFLHTGAQAIGTWWRPTAASGNGELDSGEVAEIVLAEVIPPVTALGVREHIQRIHLNLDGKMEEYNLIPGDDTYLVTARRTHMHQNRLLCFGRPAFNADAGVRGMFQATCPKFRKEVSVECYASGAITADYRIRLWGYRYKAGELGGVCQPIGGTERLVDPATGRASEFIQKPVLQPSYDNWTQLPGGLDQAVPKIFHFLRQGWNANATTANIPYEFRFDIGNVAQREEDLYFKYDIEKKIALIRGLGVRAPANLLQTWVDVGGDERPFSRWPTTEFLNALHYGRAFPMYPADFPEYFAVPLLDDPVLIAGEKAVVRVVDNGTSIAANQIAVIMNGLLVELT